jgi:sortase A
VTSAEATGRGEDIVTFAPRRTPSADLLAAQAVNGQAPHQPPADRSEAARGPVSPIRSVGLALTLLAVAILGFVGYLYFLSGVQEARAQTTLYARLQGELGLAIAPTGPTTPGSPVGLLYIPAIHLRDVVVEGTSPENLTLGPGHLRDTPLPGQAGVSVVFGRRATFGAPFGNLAELSKGDLITTITSEGQARYEVIALSDSSKPVPFSEIPNQLLLVTADSRITPAHYVEVEAKLLTSPQQEPGGLPVLGSAEVALGRDDYALVPAMAWAIALAAAALCGSFLAGKWARWPAWIVTIPVVIAIVWNLYESLSALLPNLY